MGWRTGWHQGTGRAPAGKSSMPTRLGPVWTCRGGSVRDSPRGAGPATGEYRRPLMLCYLEGLADRGGPPARISLNTIRNCLERGRLRSSRSLARRDCPLRWPAGDVRVRVHGRSTALVRSRSDRLFARRHRGQPRLQIARRAQGRDWTHARGRAVERRWIGNEGLRAGPTEGSRFRRWPTNRSRRRLKGMAKLQEASR